MNPLRLTASGLGRFASIDVEFPIGTVAIVGPNGAGKSTLLNAVELALFADGSRDLAPCLGPYADRLEIELTFEHAGDTYRVRRGYRQTAAGAGKATLDFEIEHTDMGPTSIGGFYPLTREDTKATQALICATLGLSRRTFDASAFLAQGDSANFPEATAVDRKAILGEILDPNGLWPSLADRARLDAKAADVELAQITLAVVDREQRAENLPALTAQLTVLGETAAAARITLADAEELLERAQAELAGNAAAAERVATLTLARDHAKTRHAEAVVELSRAEHAGEQLPDARQLLNVMRASAELIPGLETRLDEQRRNAAEAQAIRARRENAMRRVAQLQEDARRAHAACDETGRAVNAAQAKYTQLENAHDGHERCDRCAQLLGADARTAALASLAAEVDRLGDEFDTKAYAAEQTDSTLAIARAEADLIPAPALAEIEDIATPLADARGSANGIPTAEQNLRVLTEQADQLEQRREALTAASTALAAAGTELASATAGVKDNAQLTQAVTAARAAVATRRSTLETIAADVVRTRQTVEQLQAAAAELITLRASQAETHARLDLRRLAEKAYGRDGIPTLIAENIAIPQIEAGANEILEQLPTQDGVTFRVELRTQRELKSADHLRETLDIIVSDPDGDRAYETFSGGERARLNIALRIALARLLARRRGAESRLLAIDELEFLDELGQEKLVDVLQGLAGDFDRIMVVSHAPGVRDAFDATITIEKSDGVSRIVAGDREPVTA